MTQSGAQERKVLRLRESFLWLHLRAGTTKPQLHSGSTDGSTIAQLHTGGVRVVAVCRAATVATTLQLPARPAPKPPPRALLS